MGQSISTNFHQLSLSFSDSVFDKYRKSARPKAFTTPAPWLAFMLKKHTQTLRRLEKPNRVEPKLRFISRKWWCLWIFFGGNHRNIQKNNLEVNNMYLQSSIFSTFHWRYWKIAKKNPSTQRPICTTESYLPWCSWAPCSCSPVTNRAAEQSGKLVVNL